MSYADEKKPELWVVATPIGNLSDLSSRMVQALENCDLIAAEDTRVTMKLLNHLNLHKPLVSCHRHNEDQKADGIVERMLAENLTVALTCDAGTPGISDPGTPVVRAAREAGIKVTPICGPCAAAAAISASGFDAREFTFYGFLPREKKPLREKLKAIAASPVHVAVLYESPHRVKNLLEEIENASPDCRVCVCCDISKLYEKIEVGPVSEILSRIRENPNAEKGEYCIVCEFPEAQAEEAETDTANLSAESRMVEMMLAGLSLNEAARKLTESGVARNDAYRAKINLSRLFAEDEQ